MADLIPFNGLVYAESLKGSIGDLTTPPRIMLHAANLGFTHPTTGEELKFHAPIPPDMQGALSQLHPLDPSPSTSPD